MMVNPVAVAIFSCMVVISLMMPVTAFPDGTGSGNQTTGSLNPSIRHNHDGYWFEIWQDDNRTLHCTGLNDEGQCEIPRGLGAVRSFAVGSDFVVAGLENGSVVVWGSNRHGQHNVPPNLTNVTQATDTLEGSVAVLLENGSVIAWGNNDKGQTEVPSILANNVTVIEGSSSNFIALTRDGTVVVWGDNTFGQGNVPRDMGKIVRFAVGRYHFVALDENGSVFAWGWNYCGQCNIPRDIGKVRSIASQMDSSLISLENGTVLVYGTSTGSTGEIGPKVYPGISKTKFKTNPSWKHEPYAITENGKTLVWAWDSQFATLPTPDDSDPAFCASNRGIFNLKRVCDKALLEHPNRSIIYERIVSTAGIHFNDLCRMLSINRGTLCYHLGVLTASGKIVGMNHAGKTMYFASKRCFNEPERRLVVHLNNPTRKKMLQNLHRNGCLRRTDLIECVELSAAATACHLKSLNNDGIVQIKKSGREAYYFICPDVSPYISALIAAES